jgi:hypothetical protein
MTMKKNSLLIAVAAAALAVGSGTAFAQGMQGGPKADSPAVQSNPASKNAPAEKIPGAEHRGAKPETTGQGASERGQKMGQDLDKTKKSTTGQAPIEPKSGQANERRDNKMGQDQKKMGQDQKTLNNKSTTGQAPSQQTTPKPDRAGEQNRTNTGQMNERGGATQNENRSGANENRTGTSTSTNSSTSTSSNVSLTTEQRTKIHSIIVADRSAPRVAHVDFDVHVGTVVPRGKVKFVPLPTTIVEIEPSWRGFEYFLVGDELVVVDPATLRIVAVLPA